MIPELPTPPEQDGVALSGLRYRILGKVQPTVILDAEPDRPPSVCTDFPGKIVPLQLDANESIITHKHAFVCAESSVDLAITFTRRFGAGLVGGDGFVLQKLTGPGMAFVEMDGDAIEYHLNAGESMLIEPGHVAMFDPSVEFTIEMMRGIRNLLFSGESLFFAKLTGPGRVWLNSMTVSKVAHRVGEYLPVKS